jgi:hypothetical protein
MTHLPEFFNNVGQMRRRPTYLALRTFKPFRQHVGTDYRPTQQLSPQQPHSVSRMLQQVSVIRVQTIQVPPKGRDCAFRCSVYQVNTRFGVSCVCHDQGSFKSYKTHTPTD